MESGCVETLLLPNLGDSCRDHVVREIIPAQTTSEGALRARKTFIACVLCVPDTIQALKGEMLRLSAPSQGFRGDASSSLILTREPSPGPTAAALGKASLARSLLLLPWF